jgi:hypothetical protein
MATETVVGVFAHVDTTVRAIEALRGKGYDDFSVYTPLAQHEIEAAVERTRRLSRVRLFTLVGGLLGTASGFTLTIWTSVLWNLVTGGKPIVSIPPYVVIAFELTILFGGVATVIGILALGRLPRLRRTPAFDPRFSADRFGIAVHCPPDRHEAVREILASAGAEEVRAA